MQRKQQKTRLCCRSPENREGHAFCASSFSLRHQPQQPSCSSPLFALAGPYRTLCLCESLASSGSLRDVGVEQQSWCSTPSTSSTAIVCICLSVTPPTTDHLIYSRVHLQPPMDAAAHLRERQDSTPCLRLQRHQQRRSYHRPQGHVAFG
jgi:hypothetical protein